MGQVHYFVRCLVIGCYLISRVQEFLREISALTFDCPHVNQILSCCVCALVAVGLLKKTKNCQRQWWYSSCVFGLGRVDRPGVRRAGCHTHQAWMQDYSYFVLGNLPCPFSLVKYISRRASADCLRQLKKSVSYWGNYSSQAYVLEPLLAWKTTYKLRIIHPLYLKSTFNSQAHSFLKLTKWGRNNQSHKCA